MTHFRHPTIHDVAAQAGVSKSTVSLVLRGSDRVKPATRAQVRAAMQSVGYVYNRAAAGLRGGGSGQVGLLVSRLTNPEVASMVPALEAALARAGHVAILAMVGPAGPAAALEALRQHVVAGVILCAPDIAVPDCPEDLPLIRSLTSGRSGWDEAQGAALAVWTLRAGDAAPGRIALVGGAAQCPITQARLRGITAAGAYPVHVAGPATAAFGQHAQAHLRWAHPRLTGVICASPTVAQGLLSTCGPRAARQLAQRVACFGAPAPDQIAPGLVGRLAITPDYTEAAARAVRGLRHWLDQGDAPPDDTPLPMQVDPVPVVG